MNNIEKLPYTLKNLPDLEELSIFNNRFQTFPEVILKLSKLKLLDIGRNNFTSLPASLIKLENIEYIDLSSTPLTKDTDPITKKVLKHFKEEILYSKRRSGDYNYFEYEF